jgi:molybdate transport system substrate-binding protein
MIDRRFITAKVDMRQQKILVFVMLLILAFGSVLGVRLINSPAASAQATSTLIVSAAGSLTDALKEITPLYQQSRSQVNVRYNFASSGALQQQIENGAPADIFISAASKQMDALQQKKLLVPNTRRNLFSNRLVLVVAANRSGITDLKSLSDVRVKRIAIGDPRSVPVGQYAQESLTKAGLWESLKPKYVLANTVRQVLQFVEAGNVDAGFVFLTDAKTTAKVKIAYTIPTTQHAPIMYPIAVLKSSRNQTAARGFVEFLATPPAKRVFAKYGFIFTAS